MTERQANEAIDSDPHKHFLKPEQEVRNYFLPLNLLEEKKNGKEIKSMKRRGFLRFNGVLITSINHNIFV